MFREFSPIPHITVFLGLLGLGLTGYIASYLWLAALFWGAAVIVGLHGIVQERHSVGQWKSSEPFLVSISNASIAIQPLDTDEYLLGITMGLFAVNHERAPVDIEKISPILCRTVLFWKKELPTKSTEFKVTQNGNDVKLPLTIPGNDSLYPFWIFLMATVGRQYLRDFTVHRQKYFLRIRVHTTDRPNDRVYEFTTKWANKWADYAVLHPKKRNPAMG